MYMWILTQIVPTKLKKQLTQFHLGLRILTPKELTQEETVKQRYYLLAIVCYVPADLNIRSEFVVLSYGKL